MVQASSQPFDPLLDGTVVDCASFPASLPATGNSNSYKCVVWINFILKLYKYALPLSPGAIGKSRYFQSTFSLSLRWIDGKVCYDFARWQQPEEGLTAPSSPSPTRYISTYCFIAAEESSSRNQGWVRWEHKSCCQDKWRSWFMCADIYFFPLAAVAATASLAHPILFPHGWVESFGSIQGWSPSLWGSSLLVRSEGA